MTTQEFISYASQYQISLTESQSELLLKDMEIILDINRSVNLTAITDEAEFIDKHIIDSLLCDLSELKKGSCILDIGTGGGFPGLPLAIKYPDLQFVLMDATVKKIKIVEMIAEKLELSNVTCITGRAETLGRETQHREKYDAVVSRGVAAFSILAELSIPFIKPGGFFYAWKGPKYKEELESAANAFKVLKMKTNNINQHLLLKTNEVHVIIQTSKLNETSKVYPRNYGAIKKRPL